MLTLLLDEHGVALVFKFVWFKHLHWRVELCHRGCCFLSISCLVEGRCGQCVFLSAVSAQALRNVNHLMFAWLKFKLVSARLNVSNRLLRECNICLCNLSGTGGPTGRCMFYNLQMLVARFAQVIPLGMSLIFFFFCFILLVSSLRLSACDQCDQHWKRPHHFI